MKKIFLSLAILFALVIGNAQNTSPYWSLVGNSNATSSSKLGTTNAIDLRLFTNNSEKMRINTAGAVGIGTTAPSGSAKLDITSVTRGLLIPRMTQTQRDAIASPATGLLIYQTNSTPGFYYYTGALWAAVTAKGANTALSNLIAPVAVNADLLPNTNNNLDLGSSSSAWKNIYTGSSY